MSDAKLVLDTNIISYLMKGGALAELYAQHVQANFSLSPLSPLVNFISERKRQTGARRKGKRLETTLRNFVVIPYDHEIARCYGRLVAARQRSGKPITANDAWIAACVVRHAVPLVTHNPKDFSDIAGLKIITQWS